MSGKEVLLDGGNVHGGDSPAVKRRSRHRGRELVGKLEEEDGERKRRMNGVTVRWGEEALYSGRSDITVRSHRTAPSACLFRFYSRDLVEVRDRISSDRKRRGLNGRRIALDREKNF